MHFVPQLFPNGLAALVLLGFSLYGWSKREIPYTLPFAGIMLLGAFWGTCSTIELAIEALSAKVLWNGLHYLAPTLIIVILVWIVMKIRGRSQWLAPRRFFIFLIEPAAALVLILTGWGGRLFFSGVSLSYAGPVETLVRVAGPLYWVHAAYSYALLSFSFVLFASWARDSQPRFRSQSIIIILAILLPGFVSAFFDIGLSPLPGIDLTPAAIVVTGVLASVGIFHFRLVDITPIAGRLIAQTMEDLNLVVDARDNLVDFNPSAGSAIGIDPRHAAGRTLKELPPPWPDVFAPYSKMSSARETIRVELPEGVRWYHLAVLELRNESGAAVGRLFHLHDITERKEIEEELRGSREQLAQAQKMEAVGRLAGGIAHDFNNLLTVIIGYSDTLLGGLSEGSPLRGPIEEISHAAHRAAELTGQLLAFGRKQVLQPLVFEINDLVAKVDVMLTRLIGEHVRLVTTLHPDAGNIRADPGRIEQVLMNLAVNARDAMPSGGTIVIETQSCFLDESFVRQHPEVRPAEYVKLTVSDTGIGMETSVLSHIFEPFFTTKTVGKGTGLGLPMAYGIVKQSEGYIYCDSEPGKGSTFSIYLPRVREKATREASFVQASSRTEGNETIMLVEDDAGVRGFARALLRKHGYVVIEAASGEEALSAAASHQGRIHLLVTDVVMPRMSGLELAPAIREACPGIKVLYVSGYASGFAESSTPIGVELRLGSSFLQKPFTSEGLLSCVRETLDGP